MPVNIGQMLGGIGAAMRGQTGQFEEGLRREQEQKYIQGQRNKEEQYQRGEAGVKDAVTGLAMVEAGDINGFMGLAEERMKFNQQMGIEDTSDTERLQDLGALWAGGDEQAGKILKNQLTGMVNFGKSQYSHLFQEQERRDAVTDQGRLAQDTAEGWLTPEQANKAQSANIDPAKVKSTEILQDGTTIFAMDNGTTRAISASDEVLTGEAKAAAIKEARQYGVDIQSQRAGGRADATKLSGRNADMIERGISAAESTAGLRRGLDLLDMVETGGWDSISMKMRQKMGISGANEAELTTNLGNAVMSQLRSTFGPAFTEKDRESFEKMNAQIGNSTEGNKRILKQALAIAERTTNRAMRTARRAGYDDEVADMEELLTFSLSDPDAEKQTQAPAQGDQVQQGGLSMQQKQQRLQELRALKAKQTVG